VITGDALNTGSLNLPIDTTKKAVLTPMGEQTGHYGVQLDGISAWGWGIPGFAGKRVIVDTG
jgi:hypothetical protein